MPPSINGASGDMPQEVTVLVSKMAVLECIANGSPTPSITWQKDGQLLVEDSQHKFLASGRTLQVMCEVLRMGQFMSPNQVNWAWLKREFPESKFNLKIWQTEIT